MKSSSHYLGIFELDQNLVHPGLMFSDLPLKVQKQLKIDYETQLHPKATANDPCACMIVLQIYSMRLVHLKQFGACLPMTC